MSTDLRFRCNVCGFTSNDPSRFFEHLDKHPTGEPWTGEDESLLAQMPEYEPSPDGLIYAAAIDLADAHAPLELVAKILDKVKAGG